MDKKIKVLISFGILVGLALAFYITSYAITKYTGYSITGKAIYSEEEKIQIGECLKEKGVVLYCSSLSWNCLRQKRELGEVFDYVEYVECSENFEECKDLSLPAWKISNEFYFGIRDLGRLVESSGCEIR